MERTRRSYRDCYRLLRFPSPAVSHSAQQHRAAILAEISARTESLCAGTKFVSGALSTGCRLCVEGAWSCLFVNGTCNASCFFCPKTHDPLAPPSSDGLAFRNAPDYLAYLRTLGARGVGISGGEPLLRLDTTLEFVTAIKREFAGSIHVWLYTNGLSATAANLRKLNNAGLDEIRFNIASDRYSTAAVRQAAEIFETVVVEIPVIPEDIHELKRLLPGLADIGVRCLNLHQMWCSTRNAAELMRRKYTFLHGSRVTVLESELAALEVLEHALANCIELPVHYCSATYKHRFQTAAAFRRDARLVARDHEDITEAGLIRQLSISGSRTEMTEQRRRIELAGGAPPNLRADVTGTRLWFKTFLWDSVDLESFAPRLRYDLAHRTTAEQASESVSEIPFGDNRSLLLRRSPVKIIPAMSLSQQREFRRRFANGSLGGARRGAQASELSTQLDEYEWIDTGLSSYF